MAVLSPVARRKLGDQILEQLLHMIESGTVKPGDPLPSERELMSTFGVGRPAVREALQALQSRGLVAIHHGERARVLDLTATSMLDQIERSARHLMSTSPQTLEHLKEARLMFECAMVRLAAAKATADDLARLRQLLAAQEAARRDSQAFLEADMALHEGIAAISGNPLFAAISRAMLQWLADVHRELVRIPGTESVTIAEHAEILNCMERHSPEAAAMAMANHLTRVNQLYRVRKGGRRAPRS
ncbi:MAG: transcriptional regulator NanR [Bryobacterales bacterium]|nr:transcriptional regulator NanR [Bryobacterales bacterium]